jgi:hypothetical protein
MQITPSYATLQALGSGPSPPVPVRQSATTLAAEAVPPPREPLESRQESVHPGAGADTGTSPNDDDRPGTRLDVLA